MATDERDLREELEALARKKEQVYATRRKNLAKRVNSDDKDLVSGDSLYSRMKGRSSESPLRRGGSVGGFSTGERLTMRQMERENDRMHGAGKFDTEASAKRPRMQSAVTKPEPAEPVASERRDVRSDRSRATRTDAAASEREKRRAVAPYAQKDGLARSRRMFGALMGHLGKAKAMIEKDSTLIKRQTSKQQEAEQKEKEQTNVLELRTKHTATVEKLEDMITTTELEMKEAVTRKKLQYLLETRKGASLAHFLLTVSSPPIYYLPKKHTKETEDLLAASVEAHQEKSRASARDHESKLRELETEYLAKIEKLKEQLEDEKRQHELDEDISKEERPGSVDAQKTDISSAEVANESEHADEVMGDDTSLVSEDHVDRRVDSTSPRDLTSSDLHSSPLRPVKQEATGLVSPVSTPVGGTRKKRASSPTQHQEPPKRIKSEPAQSPSTCSSIPLKQELEHVSIGESSDTVGDMSSNMSLTASPTKIRVPPTEVLVPESSSQVEIETRSSPAMISSGSEDTAFTTPRKQKIEVGKLKVTDLREELKKRGLETKGLKQALVKRLEEALAEAGDT